MSSSLNKKKRRHLKGRENLSKTELKLKTLGEISGNRGTNSSNAYDALLIMHCDHVWVIDENRFFNSIAGICEKCYCKKIWANLNEMNQDKKYNE